MFLFFFTNNSSLQRFYYLFTVVFIKTLLKVPCTQSFIYCSWRHISTFMPLKCNFLAHVWENSGGTELESRNLFILGKSAAPTQWQQNRSGLAPLLLAARLQPCGWDGVHTEEMAGRPTDVPLSSGTCWATTLFQASTRCYRCKDKFCLSHAGRGHTNSLGRVS